MRHQLTIPHRPAHGMCPVNGIRDLIHWRSGRDWSNEFVHGLGQGGGFAYLSFDRADPPRQVYWGNASARQHAYLAELLEAGYTVVEDRSFKLAWRRAREALDEGTPPLLGPLDMFYLPYCSGLYRQRHIPMHYVLMVGYDDERVYVHDTNQEGVQTIPLEELQLAWDVSAPGLGKRNRLAIVRLPDELAPTGALVRKALADQCWTMLNPPVSLLGIPAMQKLAREIVRWPGELSEEAVASSLRQVREYLSSPPDPTGDHLTAGRDLYATFLQEAEEVTGMDLAQAIDCLRQSAAAVPALAAAIDEGRLDDAAACIERIAALEAEAFGELRRAVQRG
jgi:hypothetical protein